MSPKISHIPLAASGHFHLSFFRRRNNAAIVSSVSIANESGIVSWVLCCQNFSEHGKSYCTAPHPPKLHAFSCNNVPWTFQADQAGLERKESRWLKQAERRLGLCSIIESNPSLPGTHVPWSFLEQKWSYDGGSANKGLVSGTLICEPLARLL
jgi:hypothetical protein